MAQAKLLIDEDVYDELARALRDCGVDAVGVREDGRKGLTDEEQLSYAVSEGRAIFSFNMADYEALAVQYFREGRCHYGIIVSPQRSFGETLRRILRLLRSREAEDINDQLLYV